MRWLLALMNFTGAAAWLLAAVVLWHGQVNVMHRGAMVFVIFVTLVDGLFELKMGLVQRRARLQRGQR